MTGNSLTRTVNSKEHNHWLREDWADEIKKKRIRTQKKKKSVDINFLFCDIFFFCNASCGDMFSTPETLLLGGRHTKYLNVE